MKQWTKEEIRSIVEETSQDLIKESDLELTRLLKAAKKNKDKEEALFISLSISNMLAQFKYENLLINVLNKLLVK